VTFDSIFKRDVQQGLSRRLAVLAPFAVESGRRSVAVPPREPWQLGCARYDDRHTHPQSYTARREDVAQGQSRAHQTGLHGWCPGVAAEL